MERMSNSFIIQEQIKGFELYSCLLALLLIFWGWLLTRRPFSAGKNKNKKLPPRPPKLPIIGNLHQVGCFPHRSLATLSKKYGPLMSLQLGNKSAVVISSAAVAKEAVKNHDISISDIFVPTAAKQLFFGGKGLIFSPYGEQWKQLRSIYVNHLLHKRMIKTFKSFREEATWSLVENIDKLVSTCDQPVNLSAMIKVTANDVIFKSAFGMYFTREERNELLGFLEETVQLISTFNVGEFVPWLAWTNKWNGFAGTLDRLSKAKDKFLDALIQQRSLQTSSGDCNFLDVLIGLHKGNTPGILLDTDMLRAVIQDIFGAGTDPTAITLEWAMTELMRHPNIMEKLQDEVREVMKGKQNISDNELGKMQYLKAVVKETLRLHPPVPVKHRETNEDVQLMGYHIVAGTMVIFNLWAICRDPACWDQPETFLPERFLNSSVEYKGLDFEFIPFGVGRRVCPGMHFAIASTEHVLANLMHKFNWQLVNRGGDEDLDVIEKPGFTVGRKYPLIVVPSKPCF